MSRKEDSEETVGSWWLQRKMGNPYFLIVRDLPH